MSAPSPTAPLPAPLALVVAPLDRARLLWLRALGPLAPPLVRSRDLRVATFATGSIAVSLALTGLAPLWMLALGPIVLGVPHAASDVRYLVARQGLHRRLAFWMLVAAPLLALTLTLDPRWGFGAISGGVLAARGSLRRRLCVLVPAAVALALAWADPFVAALVVAHAHNFVAVAIWIAWRSRARALHAIPLAAFALGCAAIVGGALDPLVRAVDAWAAEPGGQGLSHHVSVLAPGFREPWAGRLVLLFAFAQSVHYAIWIRLVPEEDRARQTPRTFAASLRAWHADSGWLVIALAIALAVTVVTWALFDLAGARDAYLRGVLFHGYLELAVVGWLIAERRPLRASAA